MIRPMEQIGKGFLTCNTLSGKRSFKGKAKIVRHRPIKPFKQVNLETLLAITRYALFFG
jgi:hypothetical protein